MSTVDELASAAMDNTLADIIRNVGYAFTASLDDCQSNFINFGVREPSAIDVARIISMMIRYHTTNIPESAQLPTPASFWMNNDPKKDPVVPSHNETWNAEVFVQTLKELVSNLNWTEVILQLDHPDFIVPDRHGLNLLFSILRLGLQNAGYPANIFPVEYLCRHWTHLEGQMSLISNILKYSDIFSFADHPFHQVAVDILKSPPEIENKEIGTWRSLLLVEALLNSADRGYYVQVHEMVKFPIQHCPDILFLALLQIKPPITQIRQELLSSLLPIFLGSHPNSAIILHHAWHCQTINIKSFILHSMADWYIRGEGDQSRLARILDIAQDLKTLSLLLNVQSFPFVIDLACLASRREYLKLDKWLSDKVRDHGETFISAMVKFLQRRVSPLIGGKIPEEQLPKVVQLSSETISTMLQCLQLCLQQTAIQTDLSEAIFTIISNCQTLLMNKSRQPMSGMNRPHRVLEATYNPGGLGTQLFPPHNMDAISTLTPNIANMNLGVPANTAFAIPGSISSLVATSGSPSRLMGAGPNSPFAMMPLQHNSSVASMSALTRLGPTGPSVEKPRVQDPVVFSDMPRNVSKEAEDEGNSYFQRIYNHTPHPTLSVEEVLDMLKKFQESPNKREREVFSYMVYNLFDEYKFFPQYPEQELQITAQLFGGVIEKNILPSFFSLGIGLRYILEALKKTDSAKMFYFGLAALDRFKARVKDFSKFCEYVHKLPNYNEFPPHLIEYIEYGRLGQDPPNKPNGQVAMLRATPISQPPQVAPVTSTAYRAVVCTAPPAITVSKATSTTAAAAAAAAAAARPSIATNTNIDTLLTATEEKINPPPENVQDKTAFIFNNLSQLNLQTKCEELKDILISDYYAWLAQYLVMKRASIELNFHCLYSNFLDVLKIREINNMVTRETYRNIKVLLRSDKGIANFSDRSLLKNLGHWLGMLTLSRNQPVIYSDLDLKGLLLEAYHKGQQELLYVVPFVAKVLESCSKSKVFKPKNPWTMIIMNVLAELHQEPDLKLNLKFEIEVLCKNLSLDITDLKPTIYLKDPDKLQEIEIQLSQQTKKEAPTAAVSQAATVAAAEELLAPTPHAPEAVVATTAAVPEPRFSYVDVNVSTSFAQKICLNPHIMLFQTYPHLKQLVKPAIERAIQEWIHPIIDRSIKYSLHTCEEVIKKDFALDSDESRMRTCAHYMMRNLTAGTAMITCRDQINTTMATNLKAAFLTALIPCTSQQKEIIEAAASIITTENMELACAVIQKTAVEKALPQLDKKLMNEFEIRKLARQEGRRYYDPLVVNYQNERMPERVRLRLGGPTETQLSVYEEFACNIPGFMPVRDIDVFIPKSADPVPQVSFAPIMNTGQIYGTDELGSLITATEQYLNTVLLTPALNAQATGVHALLECLVNARRNRDINSGCSLLQKAVEGILEGSVGNSGSSTELAEAAVRHRELHLRALRLLQEPRAYGPTWVAAQVARALADCRDDLRYNLDALDCLVKAHLVNMQQYDIDLVHLMDSGNNYMAVNFAMQLVQFYLVDNRSNMYVAEADLYHTTEALLRIAEHPRMTPPEGLAALIEMLRLNKDPTTYLGEISPLGPTAHIHSGIHQARSRDFDDPPGLREKTEELMREWMKVLMRPLTEIEIAQDYNLYFYRLHMTGILKSDDVAARFFRIATRMCIDNVYAALTDDGVPAAGAVVKRDKYYVMCDAFIKLVSLFIKSIPDNVNPAPKLNVLNKILGIIAGCLLQDQEEKDNFHQLPYHRLLIILFLDMNTSEPVLESINFQVLTAFCHTLRIIRPSAAPAFCYAWLEIVSHRSFINRVLAVTPQQKGWGMYATLLIDLLKYQQPFLRNTELSPHIMLLYRGTLKVLLVLLHDFPEFLCDYHYGFCDEIPPNCIQMRNLILSAFPRNMRLPDPFTPNLKVDLLAEITLPPRAVINYATLIPSQQLKKDLDSYLKNRTPVTFLTEIRSHIQVSPEAGRRYEWRTLNALVVYIGAHGVAQLRARGLAPSLQHAAASPHMDVLHALTADLDLEGRYLLLNAIANQLRYPNSHTHYFSCCLLQLFLRAPSPRAREQITRALLERLIVNRPHPWGLLVTFIELIKNPAYNFWAHDFVHCAPEIEKLFASVASSCINETATVERAPAEP